jgi:hypothetical protein
MSAYDYQDETLIADLVRAGVGPDLVGRVSMMSAMFECVRECYAALREQLRTECDKRATINAKSRERMAKKRSFIMELGASNGADAKTLPSSSSLLLYSFPLGKKEEERKGRKKVSAPRAVPIPDGWEPSANHFEEGAALGFSRDEILDQAQDMRLWAGSKGIRRPSWTMTFSGWMRRARKTFVGKQRKAAKAAAKAAPDLRHDWEIQGITFEEWRQRDLAKEAARFEREGMPKEKIQEWLNRAGYQGPAIVKPRTSGHG